MLSNKKLVAAMALGLSLTLSACGTKTDDAIKTGSDDMIKTISELKTQISNNDEAKAKDSGEALEKSWEKFEDSVKGKDKELYEKVETPLHIIEAGVKVSPLNADTLNQAGDELESVLKEVKDLK
ncbi:hypothetical protein V7148_11885 [Gottfriedia acidiceleris]|uniref:hypothetical protein n=1 Tax=Bacillaceae TaxID=186817 RepID=UPI000BEC761E|nr:MULTISPECIES: hypothetical protein [unclassified Bacillus (in: firmicutes)]PEC50590.1 hypothetical protein CON00_06570 [Bacillus sp. AFS096315]PFM81878.1 hypothetical protein COJ46_07340 [Bacillus sp. AFS077874]